MKFLGSLIFVSLLSSCATVGTLDKSGFEHKKMGYKIPYLDKTSGQFLPKNWRMEKDARGRIKLPDSRQYTKSVTSYNNYKKRVGYQPLNLIFNHAETNGVISVHSYPLSELEKDKKLDILAQNYTNALSGKFFATLTFSGRVRLGASKTWVSKLLKQNIYKEGGVEILEAVIEVANSDQLKLDPNHRDEKVKIVMMKPDAFGAWSETYKNKKGEDYRLFFPSLIVMIYSMNHGYYADYEKEFDQFVDALKLRPKPQKTLSSSAN
ncbi:MAG: hypothetical protein HRU19_27455 [Pseudobacteriovorax sp.]|nr:hypothetical protein [Pseudobacteriovorax sp.]